MKKIIFAVMLIVGVLTLYASMVPTIPPKVSALSKATLIYLKPNKVLTAKMNKPIGSVYKNGEAVSFTVENTVSGYLYILDIPPEGTVTRIYPNYYERNNFLRAGKHEIPAVSKYKFIVSGKRTGLEFVEFILSTRPLNFLGSSATRSHPFPIVSGAGKKEYVKFKVAMMKELTQKFEKWTAWTYFYVGNDETKTVLNVKTEPTKCSLYIDGKYYGVTPALLSVSPGYHDVKVSMKGYKTWEGVIYVEFGKTKILSVNLVPNSEALFGFLSISVNPQDATVYVDGKSVGSGSQRLKLSVGYHSVKVTMKGYQAYYNGAVKISSNQTTALNVVLNPLTANLYIRSQPYVNVYIDGVYAGGTGYDGVLYLQNVKVGYHQLKFSKEWYISQKLDYNVMPGDNFLSVTLNGAGMLKVSSNIYPVKIEVDGKYFGKVDSMNEGVYVPIGTHRLTFSNPEYITIGKVVSFAFQRTTIVPLDMKLKPLTMDVRISPNPFSPNGDWYEDTTTFYVILSRRGTLRVNIYKEKKLIWSRDLEASYGTNRIIWDGNSNNGLPMPNGVYKVEFMVNSYGKSMVKSLDVVINKNVYTYLKQMIIVGGILVVLGLLYLIFK